MKKKILFVLNNMNIGGTEKAFLNQVNELPLEKYDITLLLLEKSGGFMEYIPKEINVNVMNSYENMKEAIMLPPLGIIKKHIKEGNILYSMSLLLGHAIFKITKDRTLYYRIVLKSNIKDEINEKYDIAIAYCGPFDFLTVYVLYFVKSIKKIQWIHFDVSKFNFNTKMCRKLYPKFDQINVVSDEARLQLLKKIPTIKNKTFTCLNTVSANQCKKMADEENGFMDQFDGIRIITIGRLSEEKGQDIIPEIAAALKEKRINFKWYLIGDGKLRGLIEKRCKMYSVEDNVILLGTKPNPYPYLKEADLYIQTSIHEGFCITLAEAKVFDLPIISTDCAGAHEQLDNQKNCKVVKRTAIELFNAIKDSLSSIKKKEYDKNDICIKPKEMGESKL